MNLATLKLVLRMNNLSKLMIFLVTSSNKDFEYVFCRHLAIHVMRRLDTLNSQKPEL